ncbi:MAG TPA: TnsA endonuclease N-terminal domain-containing protein [Pyrinomonadaceae bacterium]|nr:TnsA endonuclease N-terminal domain-containing protein [Pyrinomonadaceae bacterium]
MGRRRTRATEASIERWIKEGRGGGEGAEYKPWLHVWDVASKGRCHEIPGWGHGRVHHLLSDLEAFVFFIYEWARRVIEIKEQFPLFPLEETLAIAEEIGVAHPTDPITKHPMVMSTDFVLKVRSGLGFDYYARQVKYASALCNYRTLEKLEIERRYWLRRSVDYGLVTELDVPMPLVRNVKWVHPRLDLARLQPLTEADVREVAHLLTETVLTEDAPLRKLTSACDSHLGLTRGDSLKVVRHLIAIRYWQVDMSQPIKQGERLVLLNTPGQELYREERLIA